MTISVAEQAAMRRALSLAATPGVPLGPNPRVGCVLLTADGTTIAEGHHRGAGTPHAEVDALAAAGGRARGATAVVTLEPCNHTGRTGPCAEALIAAGVRRVVVAQPDPNPVAQGGTETLRAAGIEVEVGHGLLEEDAVRLNRAWAFALSHGRPMVTWKFATTLDGHSAAADGTSRWISSATARLDVHRLRGECDVMMVGTNTIALDDPHLTVRDADGQVLSHQPLRVVVGVREPAPDRRVLDDAAETLHVPSHDPAVVLRTLHDLGRRHVLLEGGPTLAAAFLRAGLVDEVVAYIAPTLLGAGAPVVADLGIATIADAMTMDVEDVLVIAAEGDDPTNLRITLSPRRSS